MTYEELCSQLQTAYKNGVKKWDMTPKAAYVGQMQQMGIRRTLPGPGVEEVGQPDERWITICEIPVFRVYAKDHFSITYDLPT